MVFIQSFSCIIYIYGNTTWRGPFKVICDWPSMGVVDYVQTISRAAVDVKFNTDRFHII